MNFSDFSHDDAPEPEGHTVPEFREGFESCLPPDELLEPPGPLAFAEPRPPRAHEAALFLPDLLEFLAVELEAVHTVAVHWGDESGEEQIDLNFEVVNYDHQHCYSRAGFYQAVVTVWPDRGSSWRRRALVKVCRRESEVVLMEPIG